jgi:phage-related protein
MRRALSGWQLTWWYIAEVAAFQHFINASHGCKNTQIFIPRGKAAILAICSLSALAAIPAFFLFSCNFQNFTIFPSMYR